MAYDPKPTVTDSGHYIDITPTRLTPEGEFVWGTIEEEILHDAVVAVTRVVKVVAIAGGLVALGAIGAFAYGIHRAFFASNGKC